MKNISIRWLFLAIVAMQVSVFAQTANLENLYQNRQYFELRDALAKVKNDKSPEVLFYRGLIANRFNQPEKSIEYLQKFLRKGGESKNLRAGYEALADNYSKTYEYGKSADTYKILIDRFSGKVTEEELNGYKNLFGLWNALAASPRQNISVAKNTEIKGTRDKARLLNIPVEAAGQKLDFVFDTGANLSTMTVSTAQKLGLQIIESDVTVGSATDKSVKSKLAVAPELKIGDILVKNAVFLVLEDKAMYFQPINYQINAIIGFPVIKSLGRVTLTRDDKIFVAAKNEKTPAEPNMLLEGLLPLAAGTYNGKRMLFSFDTGAVTSNLYHAFYEAEKEIILKQSAPEKVKFGGAGGYSEVTAHKLKDLDLEIGGKTARFPKITVLTESVNTWSRYYYGNLGQDLIKQFERMTLDFNAMRIVFE